MSDETNRRCAAVTKKQTPCEATPLKPGTVIEEVAVSGDWCRAHDPDVPETARFGSHAQATEAGNLGGRPRTPRAVEVIRERLEAELDEWLEPLTKALYADQPYTVGFGKDAYVEMVPDHKMRLHALEIALDRSYGRPKQQTEITGEGGGPLEVVSIVPSDADERSAKAAALLKRHGYVDA